MIKQISVGLMLSLSTIAYADDHANSSPGPVETWNCVLNDGKSMDDVRKVTQSRSGFLLPLPGIWTQGDLF
jgi:hypothetical protein